MVWKFLLICLLGVSDAFEETRPENLAVYIQKRTEMTCGLGGTNVYDEALNSNDASVNSSYRSIVLWKFYPPGDDSRHVIYDGYETKDDFYPKIVVNKTGPLLYHMVIKWTRYEHAGTYDCMIVTNNDSYSDVINYRNYLTVLESDPVCRIVSVEKDASENGTNPENNITILEGGEVRMQCSVRYRGKMQPTMSWSRENSDNSKESVDRDAVPEHRFSHSTTSTFTLKATASSDLHPLRYECRTYLKPPEGGGVATNEIRYSYVWKSPYISIISPMKDTNSTQFLEGSGMPKEGGNSVQMIVVISVAAILAIALVVVLFVCAFSIYRLSQKDKNDDNYYGLRRSNRPNSVYAEIDDMAMAPDNDYIDLDTYYKTKDDANKYDYPNEEDFKTDEGDAKDADAEKLGQRNEEGSNYDQLTASDRKPPSDTGDVKVYVGLKMEVNDTDGKPVDSGEAEEGDDQGGDYSDRRDEQDRPESYLDLVEDDDAKCKPTKEDYLELIEDEKNGNRATPADNCYE